MMIYYQKHRQIQALQFDGTWIQLRHFLPPTMFDAIIERAIDQPLNPQYSIKIHYNQDHTINTIDANQMVGWLDRMIIWPQHRYKIKHPLGHWRHLFGPLTKSEIQKQTWNYYYDESFRMLQYGDFLVLTYDPIAPDHVKLQIYPPQHFLSHWSNRPIP